MERIVYEVCWDDDSIPIYNSSTCLYSVPGYVATQGLAVHMILHCKQTFQSVCAVRRLLRTSWTAGARPPMTGCTAASRGGLPHVDAQLLD